MVSTGWIFLAAMIGAYGGANLLQSMAAAKTAEHATLHPALLVRLAQHRTYLWGILFQVLGFVLAFLARRDLPLFLVQASVAAGLGVTAVLGVVVLNWQLPRAEVMLLVVLGIGIGGLVISALPAPSRQLGMRGELALVIALGAVAVLGVFAARLHGAPGSVALGGLAGLAFGAAAVASRPLASVHTLDRFLTNPLLYLLVAHSIVGQLLLGLAMQRGSTTAAVAAMDATAAIPAAVIGLLFLGDAIRPGMEWLAAFGFLLTLVTVIGLTFFAEPQHHHETGRHRRSGTEPGKRRAGAGFVPGPGVAPGPGAVAGAGMAAGVGSDAALEPAQVPPAPALPVLGISGVAPVTSGLGSGPVSPGLAGGPVPSGLASGPVASGVAGGSGSSGLPGGPVPSGLPGGPVPSASAADERRLNGVRPRPLGAPVPRRHAR